MPDFSLLDRSVSQFLSAALAVGATACGGKVVVDGGGGEPGTPVLTTTTTTTTTTTATTWTTTTDTSSSSSSSSSGGGAPPIPALVEVDFGQLAAGPEKPFDVAAGALGVTAVTTTPQPFAAVGFETLVSPMGNPLVADYGIAGTHAQFYSYGIGVVAEPVSSDAEAMPLASGTWWLAVGSPGGANVGSAHLSTWTRQTVDGEFHGGLIDVNLYVVDGVADTSYLTDTVAQAFTGWAGLDLGTIHVLPLDESYYQIDDNNFFDALEETAGAPGKPALNILCVGYLAGSLEGAAGVTPGAPSMPLIHGTHQSGLFWMVLQDPSFDPIIVQHEAGHFAGLMHTSEFDGLGDALSDTPPCADPLTDPMSCPDFNNLMFPTGGDLSGTLTHQQRKVVAGSTLYRGRVQEGGAAALPLDQADSGGAPSPERSAVERVTPRHPALPPQRGRWTHGLTAHAVAHLTGIGCPGGGASYFDVLRALGADDPATLLSIGTDADAPPLARVRALAAAGRAAPTAEALDILADVATADGVAAQLRLGALDGIAAASPSRALALAGSLASSSDPFVRAAARRRAAR